MTSNFWRYFWPPVAWAAVLFIQSSISKFDAPLQLSRWDDKWAHVLIYMPLGFLLMQAMTRSEISASQRRMLLLTLLIGSLYGASDEFHQYFVPGRSPDWRDWIADSFGVALGTWIFLKSAKRSQRRAPHRQTHGEKIEH
jgi:VanZ family protein